MPTSQINIAWKPSKEELDLIQGFEADYNKVDRFLRETFSNSDPRVPFSHLINLFSDAHPGWPDAGLLRIISEVRNAIVHKKTEPYGYAAIPTPDLAKKLKVCRNRLIEPALAIPHFQCAVEKVSIQDTLETVLRIINNKDYSQFPVYEANLFRGLLTENGITRWLAKHVATKLALVDLTEVSVNQIIENDEKRENYRFLARNTRLDDLVEQFSSHKLLEAALFTANGKQSEALLGIATRWDIIHNT
jgi:predicted transcriptional regulator